MAAFPPGDGPVLAGENSGFVGLAPIATVAAVGYGLYVKNYWLVALGAAIWLFTSTPGGVPQLWQGERPLGPSSSNGLRDIAGGPNYE
jgi:hypothetical protein